MDYLKTDDIQFGFKNNHSTVLCTAIYIETINYFLMRVVMFIVVLLTQAKLFTGYLLTYLLTLFTYPLHPMVGHKATIVVSVTVSFHGIESLLSKTNPQPGGPGYWMLGAPPLDMLSTKTNGSHLPGC